MNGVLLFQWGVDSRLLSYDFRIERVCICVDACLYLYIFIRIAVSCMGGGGGGGGGTIRCFGREIGYV